MAGPISTTPSAGCRRSRRRAPTCSTRRACARKARSARSARRSSKPVNVIMGLAGTAFSVEQLAALGVRRISLGSALARAALGEFLRAARGGRAARHLHLRRARRAFQADRAVHGGTRLMIDGPGWRASARLRTGVQQTSRGRSDDGSRYRILAPRAVSSWPVRCRRLLAGATPARGRDQLRVPGPGHRGPAEPLRHRGRRSVRDHRRLR